MGVVGSCNVDVVVRCAELPRAGETVLGDDLRRLPGGKGANQAAAAARLGARVTLLASLGDDEDGEWLRAGLAADGVDVSLVQCSPRPTGVALITVDARGENVIVVAPGANGDLDLAALDLAAFDVVLASMEVPAAVVDDAARRSRSFILNVAPARPVAPATLERCAVVIANEREAESLDASAIDHLIVTRGVRGAEHRARGRLVASARPPAVTPLDTVGAGDVFCAAYATQFARGVASDAALAYAVTAGAIATLGAGARGALPTNSEVVQWLERASS